MLENKKVYCGFDIPVYYSRLIASWNNSGGYKHPWLFDDRDVCDCYEMYTCGKLEVEVSAKKIIEKHKNDEVF